jgi:DNA-binding transcriptional regulator of glucitol operon
MERLHCRNAIGYTKQTRNGFVGSGNNKHAFFQTTLRMMLLQNNLIQVLSSTGAQRIVLKEVLKFTLKQVLHVSV